MRVTAQAKAATRKLILQTARRLFAASGFDNTRTRDIAVAAIAARHGHSTAPSPTALQLYWTLYTGILAFWSTDASPRQEDTLALIDDSLSMFVAWLSRQPSANPGTR